MCCNQAPYKERTHPKMRDWTASTLQQERKTNKKNPTKKNLPQTNKQNQTKTWGWHPRRKKQLCMFSLPIFQQVNLSLLQIPPHTPPCPRQALPTAACTASPCVWFMCRLTSSPYTPAKLCCCLNVPYLQPAEKETLSAQHHHATDLNSSQHPCDHSLPMTARSEDHVYI